MVFERTNDSTGDKKIYIERYTNTGEISDTSNVFLIADDPGGNSEVINPNVTMTSASDVLITYETQQEVAFPGGATLFNSFVTSET